MVAPEGGPDGEGVPAEGSAGRALPPLAPEQLPLRVVGAPPAAVNVQSLQAGEVTGISKAGDT